MASVGGSAAVPQRILWTYQLERSLVNLSKEARKERHFVQALERLWHAEHPQLPSRGTALAQKLKRVMQTHGE